MRALSLAVVALAACLAAGCSPTSPTPAAVADAGADAGPPAKGTVETFVEIETNSEGLAFAPSATGAVALYFGGGNAVWAASPEGKVTKIVDLPAPLGIAALKGGDLVVCGKGEGAIGASDAPGVLWRITPGGAKSLLVGPGASSFKLTNFVAVAPDGALAFSDSAGNKVYRASADGSGVALVTDAITYPNGMAFSPDGKTLYVASWNTKQLYSLARAADGSYGAPTVAFEGIENVDGLAVESTGALWLVASGAGVVRVGPDRASSVVAPGSSFNLPANGAFGVGPFGERWLYVTNLLARHISRVYVDATGAPLGQR